MKIRLKEDKQTVTLVQVQAIRTDIICFLVAPIQYRFSQNRTADNADLFALVVNRFWWGNNQFWNKLTVLYQYQPAS